MPTGAPARWKLARHPPAVQEGSISTDNTPRAIYVPTAFVAKSGVIDFAHQNARCVHGGVLYRDADNSARAQRRRIAREARRVARKEGRR